MNLKPLRLRNSWNQKNHRMTQQHQTQPSSRFHVFSVNGNNRVPNQSPVSMTVETQQGGTLEWITITSQSCCNGRANLFSRDSRSPRLFTRRIRYYQHSSKDILNPETQSESPERMISSFSSDDKERKKEKKEGQLILR